jgi:Protein phosphatase 2C
MQKQPEQRFPSLVETQQHEDTFQHLFIDNNLQLRLCSVRCTEAHEADLPCQDYALITSYQDSSSLTFCVSDGVGGSYRGDFSAYYLANKLVHWLQALPGLSGEPRHFTRKLEAQLRLWARKGHEDLQHKALPTNIPPLLREVLEEHRTLNGSETVFFAGRIDYKDVPPQKKVGQALFCWMGNVSAHIFIAPGKHMQLSNGADETSDRNRWSTRYGPRGMLTGLTMPFHMVDRLIVHTDGLDHISAELAHLDDETLLARMQELLQLPTNDDMTMLDLQWNTNVQSFSGEDDTL